MYWPVLAVVVWPHSLYLCEYDHLLQLQAHAELYERHFHASYNQIPHLHSAQHWHTEEYYCIVHILMCVCVCVTFIPPVSVTSSLNTSKAHPLNAAYLLKKYLAVIHLQQIVLTYLWYMLNISAVKSDASFPPAPAIMNGQPSWCRVAGSWTWSHLLSPPVQHCGRLLHLEGSISPLTFTHAHPEWPRP